MCIRDRGYEPEKEAQEISQDESGLLDEIIERLRTAKRPVLYAGNGIRLSGGYEQFREAVELLGIPVVTTWDGIDEIEDCLLYTSAFPALRKGAGKIRGADRRMPGNGAHSAGGSRCEKRAAGGLSGKNGALYRLPGAVSLAVPYLEEGVNRDEK